MSSHVMNTYGRLPFALSHGRGCRVWDTEGRAYLDGFAWGLAAPQQFTHFVTMDADGSHDPAHLQDLLAVANKALAGVPLLGNLLNVRVR